MKRWLILALFAPSAVLAQSKSGLTNYPVPPRAEAFSETVFGVRVDDPYRWMEKADNRSELTEWVNASSAHTTAQLSQLPGHAGLRAELAEASRSSHRYLSATVAGPRTFYLKMSAGSQMAALWVREGGKDRVLLDPAAGRQGGGGAAISSYSVAPGGDVVAVNQTVDGSEIGEVSFYNVTTGATVGERLPRIWGDGSVTWLDDKTVLYARIRETKPGEDQLQRQTIMLHRFGTSLASDLALLGTDVPTGFKVLDREVPFVATSRGSNYVLATTGGAQASVRMAVATVAALRAGKPDWRELATLDDEIVRDSPALVGDTLRYVTTKRTPQGEVRSLALYPGATLAGSKPVLNGKGVISATIFTRDGSYAFVTTPFAASRIWYAPTAGQAREVKLPFVGSAFFFNRSVDEQSGSFAFDGFQRSTSSFRLDRGRLTSLGLDAATLPAARNFVVAEEWARSGDGTRVPLTIVSDRHGAGPRPTIIEAYGSYGVSEEPQYSPSFTVWIARGGVYAQCHTRGGGEFGRAWHDGGRGSNKPNAQADLIACGRRMLELGYASPATLGVFGSSAGGLLAPVAAMKAPDLFAAAVTRVGVVNPTRLAAANNGANQFEEMGDPGTEDGFKALAAQDSTFLLSQVKGGPDFFFPIGLSDSRVDPWMSAKLVAMMRARWGDEHLALLRSDEKAGHGLNSSRDQMVAERTDIFAFFLNRFGQPGFVR